jgi:tetratricopeptide (TPR) repeat protein
MDSRARATQQLRDTLKEYFEQIRLARAAELARSGRYLEAERLFFPIGRESLDLREIDLLARISAQQRQYERARDLWEYALQRAPENADYKRAIQNTREAERFYVIFRRVVIIGLFLVISAVLAIRVYHHSQTSSPAQSEDKVSSVHGNSAAPADSQRLPNNDR